MKLKKIPAFIAAFAIMINCIPAAFAAAGASAEKINDVFSSDASSISDYSVTTGYKLNDNKGIQYSAVGVYNIISAGKTTGNDFILETTIHRSYNWHYLYINYVDDKNYTEIALNSPMKVTNVSNGKSTDVATIENSDVFNGKEIKVKLLRKSGKLKLIIGNKTYFEGIEDTNACNGRYGVRFAHCPSYIKGFKVSSLLNIVDCSLMGEDTHRVSDDITLVFDYDIDAAAVSKDNIYISGPSGKISEASYDIVHENSDSIRISFNQPLEHDTDYKLVIGEGLKIDTLSHGLCETKEISFVTEPYPFLTELKTKNNTDSVSAWVEIENNFFTQKEAVVFITSEKTDGTTALSFEPEVMTIDEKTEKSSEVTIPEGSYFENIKYFIWDSDMHRIFPEFESYPDTSSFKAEAEVIGNTVKVSGVLPSKGAGKTVTFIMGNPGEEADITKAPSKVSEVLSGENGSFVIEFPIKDTVTSADYFYKISGDDFKEPYSNSFYFASENDKNKASENFNEILDDTILSDEEKVLKIEELIKSSEKMLSLSSDAYKGADVLKLAEILLSEGKRVSDNDAGVELKNLIDISAVVNAFNESNVNLIADDELLLVNEDIFSFAELDTEFDTTVYSMYMNLSFEAREQVINSVIGKAYTNINDIYKDFAESVVLYGIKGAQSGGSSHIYELLSKNAGFVGLNISEYLKLERTASVDEALVSSEFTSLEELEAVISELAGNIDPSVVSYDFRDETKEENWIIENTATSAAFTGGRLNAPSTCSMGIITRDKYSAPVQLNVNMNSSYNYRNIIFAYQDSSNYCYIEPRSTGVLLYKVAGGAKELVGTYDYPLSTTSYVTYETEITVKPDSSIDIVFIYENARLDVAKNVKDEAFGTPGGFGARFVNSTGYISKVKASMYPTVRSSNISDEFEVTDNAEFEFNFALNPDTITKESVKVTDSDLNPVDYELIHDGKLVTVDFT